MKELRAGKIPNDRLRTILKSIDKSDPSVVVHPGVGEDAAIVKHQTGGLLSLKTDPVTFATARIGWYTVAVNANDLAASGAIPRWFLSTVLLPVGITDSEVTEIIQELSDSCSRLGISLCGGHTEVTDAVSRPVVCGTMVGTVDTGEVFLKGNVGEGDSIVLTKGLAVEGTSLIAMEFPDCTSSNNSDKR